MACHHPPEELQRVYDGGPTPLPGRFFCSLCGEPVYALPTERTENRGLRTEVPPAAALIRSQGRD